MNAPEPQEAPEAKTAEEITAASSEDTDRRLKWAIVRFAFTVVVVVGLITFLAIREGNTAREIKQSQIENCEKNGNTLRRVLAKRIHHEIEQNNSGLIKKLFPNIPEEELESLIKNSVAERRREIKEVRPLDCEEVYK